MRHGDTLHKMPTDCDRWFYMNKSMSDIPKKPQGCQKCQNVLSTNKVSS